MNNSHTGAPGTNPSPVFPPVSYLACPVLEALTWRRAGKHLLSGNKLCGRAMRRRGREWLPRRTSQPPPSPAQVLRRTCLAGTCRRFPDKGRTHILESSKAERGQVQAHWKLFFLQASPPPFKALKTQRCCSLSVFLWQSQLSPTHLGKEGSNSNLLIRKCWMHLFV